MLLDSLCLLQTDKIRVIFAKSDLYALPNVLLALGGSRRGDRGRI